MPTFQSVYRTLIKDPFNGDIFEVFPKSFEFTEELNKGATGKLTFALDDIRDIAEVYETTALTLLTGKMREVYVQRKNNLNTFQNIFWGVISEFNLSAKGNNEFELSIDVIDWINLLGRRYVGIPITTYTATDAGAIAWGNINETQTRNNPYSDFGITQGTIQTSVNRDRTWRFDNVRDTIIALSNSNLENGFDFEITSAKVFNVYYPTKGVDRPNLVFDLKTSGNFGFKKKLIADITNRAYVVGEAVNNEVTYRTRDASNSFKTDFKLLEAKLNESQVKDTATLDDKGDRYLALKQQPAVLPPVEHYDDEEESFSILDYNLGDVVYLNYPDIEINMTGKRVLKRIFTLDPGKSMGYIKLTFL